MTLLIIGTALFFGVHLLPSITLKTVLVNQLGVIKYKLLFSVCSLAGLGMMIYGFKLSPFVPLWDPLPWGRAVAVLLMPVAVILLCAADMPNNIKRIVRHPMLLGLMFWAGSHLMANGDLASTIIFLSFALFAVLDWILVTVAGRYQAKAPVSVRWDITVVVVGILLYCLLYYFHGSFTGMTLF